MKKSNVILKYSFIGIVTVLISCSSSSQIALKSDVNCEENLAFKKEFFKNIKNVENLIFEVQGESLENSLKFIGKYTHVSFESMTNYAGTYPSGIFDSDKKVWLEWYEKNKCQNIKFKE
ncbi:hypothetical protein [Lacinutrix sp. MEBiC02595]